MSMSSVGLWMCSLLVVVPSLALAGVDGTPSFDPQTDSGLFVWRTWNGNWQARVLAADGDRQVTGSFQSSGSGIAASPVALEADDVLQVADAGTVEFDLRTAAQTVDGMMITGTEGRVCLRTNTSVPIFLGRDEEPAASPVDLTSNGACADEPPPTAGLDVFRSTKFDWVIELASGDTPRTFDGVFEFSLPLESYEEQELEGGDQVSLAAADRLTVLMNTWPGGGRDLVRFTTPEFSKICLRASDGSAQQITLSSPGRAEPFLVTTPVDLTNNGACGPPADPFPPPTLNRKFNVGHYVALTQHDDEVSMAESMVQGVRGFIEGYSWRELEPSWGVYDFSAIEEDLRSAEALGAQLIATIQDKSFAAENPAPAYLNDWFTMENRAGGYTVVRWNPYVKRRYKALIRALGRHFDGHPNFEGIATSESAPSVDMPLMQAKGYTPEAYREALVDVLSSAAESFPSSRVFWYMNFLPGANYYMGEVMRAVAPTGVVLGGPDVLPDDFALQIQAYPFYDGAVGRMPLFNQVEPVCYHHPHEDPSYPTRFWTPLELFGFARDELHVSYMFWTRWRWRIHQDSYNWWDAIPVIEDNPEFNRE